MTDIEQVDELRIVHYPHEVLKQRASRIETIDTNIEKLALKMIELMHQYRGVGLAGNQVAVPLRIFVANPTCEEGEDIVFINPEIIEVADWNESEEGCLSVPQVNVNIRRRKKIVVSATDLSGKAVEMPADQLLARIVQHELDHLDGKTIIDRMSKLARLTNRKQIKYLEEHPN